jgi:Flp pilus assembly protein TadG
MTGRRFWPDSKGAVATEMALVLPFLIALLFGGFEVGHFLWMEHKVIQAVRDGARYGSRLPIETVCPDGGSSAEKTQAIADISLLTRTGQLTNASAPPVVPGWDSNSQVVVTYSCGTFLSTGIYTTYGGAGPTITVRSNNLYYPSLFEALGFITSSVQIGASANTAVIGI